MREFGSLTKLGALTVRINAQNKVLLKILTRLLKFS